MPSQVSRVGPLTIPLPSEGYPTGITDPTIEGLLDYFRFWIRDGLGQKIEDPNTTQPDPLPEGHTFGFDPGDNWVRLLNDDGDPAIPALYLWQSAASKVEDYSILYEARRRTLKVMYVAKPIFGPEGSPVFSGLGAAVDAILLKSYARGYHSDYGYNGDPRGTKISISLNLLGWKYEGGQPGVMAPVPGTSPRVGGPTGGNVVEYYPAMIGTLTVLEKVEQETLEESDRAYEIPFAAGVNDPADVRGPLTIMDRYLISPSESNDRGE